MNTTLTDDATALDDSFAALSDPVRRRILVRLADDSADDPVLEIDATSDPSGRSDGDAVRLVHVHLPKLDDLGFIEWDRERDAVRRGPRFDEIAPLLDLLIEHRAVLPDT